MRGHEGFVSHISDTQHKDRYGKLILGSDFEDTDE